MDKKIIATIYCKDEDTAVGKVYYLNRFNFLSENYDLIILTNQPSFIKRNVKKAKVVYLPNFKKLPFSVYIYWTLCKLILSTQKFDILFLISSDYLNSIFNFDQPTITSVDVNPLQVVGKRFCQTEVGIISKIHLSILIRGITNSDKIIVVSEQLKKFCVSNAINPAKIEYLPHGVDLDIFNSEIEPNYINLDSLKGKFIIMYTGWVSEMRGMNLLLDAMKSLYDEDIALVFLGCDKNYADKINEYAKINCIEQNIVALGAVDPWIVPYYLKLSSICVSLLEFNEYYQTSPPQKLFEYFAMGKPVLANNIPTHTDYIINGYNGFIIDDINGFRESVLKLYKDKALYAEMSRNAIESAEKYDINLINAQLMKILSEFTEKK